MSDEADADDLIARCAQQNDVSPEVVRKLIALEAAFPDFTVWGSKAEFSRQVARLLDAATTEANAPS